MHHFSTFERKPERMQAFVAKELCFFRGGRNRTYWLSFSLAWATCARTALRPVPPGISRLSALARGEAKSFGALAKRGLNDTRSAAERSSRALLFFVQLSTIF